MSGRPHETPPENEAIPERGLLELAKRTLTEWWTDDAPRHAAALSFCSALSIAPLLLNAISVAGLAFGREAAEGRGVTELRTVLGQSAAETVEPVVESANKPATGVFATIAGVAVLLVGASVVFAEHQSSLDRSASRIRGAASRRQQAPQSGRILAQWPREPDWTESTQGTSSNRRSIAACPMRASARQEP